MPLEKTTASNLLKLCAFMEKLPKKAEKHFDMSDFLAHGSEHSHPSPTKPADLMTCGTTACALGWAATMPYFRKLGLRFDQYGSVQGDERAFNLETHQWILLFNGENTDPTPKEWAKRARKLIKEWRAK